ncbi:hypothetical protein OAN22_00090 [Alphaproteobacteria bacterium]|nr:hypothetical protein [Alphaproteobacteria bacterium]
MKKIYVLFYTLMLFYTPSVWGAAAAPSQETWSTAEECATYLTKRLLPALAVGDPIDLPSYGDLGPFSFPKEGEAYTREHMLIMTVMNTLLGGAIDEKNVEGIPISANMIAEKLMDWYVNKTNPLEFHYLNFAVDQPAMKTLQKEIAALQEDPAYKIPRDPIHAKISSLIKEEGELSKKHNLNIALYTMGLWPEGFLSAEEREAAERYKTLAQGNPNEAGDFAV